ncbi:hypothetical protein BSN85_38705 [Bradyrhizobium brasilense]|nr:hypothetical protein BSN85_38705 [Bradyrhizobium brasilense]
MTSEEMRAMAAQCDDVAVKLLAPERAIVRNVAAQSRMLAHQSEMLRREWRSIRPSSETVPRDALKETAPARWNER